MTSPAARDAAEDEITDALLALSRVLIGIAARSVTQLDEDVTLAQFRALVLLVSHGPQRVVDLARQLSVRPSTATRLCDRLVRKGLVARHAHPGDRRAAQLALTEAGRDLVGTATRRRREAIGELVREVSITRPLAFAAALDALVEAAGEAPMERWWKQWESAVLDQPVAAERPA